MKQNVKFNMNGVGVFADWMKFYVIQNKIGIMMNVPVSVKN